MLMMIDSVEEMNLHDIMKEKKKDSYTNNYDLIFHIVKIDRPYSISSSQKITEIITR